MAKDKDTKEQKRQDAKPKQGDGEKGAPQPKPAQQAKPQGKKDAPKAPPIAKEEGPRIPAPPARLATYYREKVVPELTQKFGYKTVMQVPRLKKITLNMGVGETTTDKKVLDNAVADMTRFAGQKPVVTKSRKSSANFKMRANFPAGRRVTLRGARRCSRSSTTRAPPTRRRKKRAASCRSCRAMRLRCACATAAPSPAGRAASIGNSAWGATSCATLPSRAKCPASSRQAGKRDRVRRAHEHA